MLDFVLHTASFPLLTAFLLGVMTMVSPCPFCSDVTAISYLAKNINRKRTLLLNGMCYVLGKCFSYTSLALLFILGAETEGIRTWLETYGEHLLGPFLILAAVAIALFGYHEARHHHNGNENENDNENDNANANHSHEHHHEHAPHRLIRRLSASEHPLMQHGLGAFLLGAVFALAFCPYSGLLYFGTLMPLTIAEPASWSWLMPICFGLGDALPVLIISFLISYGIQGIGTITGRLTGIEVWLRRICVIIFLAMGLYISVGHHHDHEHEHEHEHEHAETAWVIR